MTIDWQAVDNNLTDPKFFAGQEFHGLFTMLRAEDPVHWTTGSYPRGYWSVTRHEDCKAVMNNPDLFSSADGTHLPPGGRELSADEKWELGYDVKIQAMDQPKHTTMRRPLNKHFSVPVVGRMRESVEEVVDNLIDTLAGGTDVEFVDAIASELPVHVFLAMMGVPQEDWAKVQDIASGILGVHDPKYRKQGENPTAVHMKMSRSLYDYLVEHLAVRRAAPTDDFASLIAHLEVEGAPMDERAAGWLAWNIVSGGLETTRNAAAVGLLELLRRPEQAELIQDEAVAKTAVEEIVRWVCPSKQKLRVARADTEIGGKQIKQGDWVLNWIVSGNRDESVFERPQEFDVTRDPNPHLGFGEGIHMCLGRNVARLELAVLLPRLLARVPDLRLAGAPEWLPSDNSSGLISLPLSYTTVR